MRIIDSNFYKEKTMGSLPKILFCWLAASNLLFAESLKTFDVEIEQARATTENIRLKLEASKSLFNTANSATKEQSNKNALVAARHWQDLHECRSAVREYQSFIHLSQKIEEEEAKEAYLSLAHCFKASRADNKAFKFYRLFISSYMTSKKKNEDVLIKSLQDLIDISTHSSILSATEVKKLIASLSVLADNKENSAKVKLWSAKLAERFGYTSTAVKWYQSIYSDKELKDDSTKILAYYYDSLMKFSKGENQDAKLLLKKAITLAEKPGSDASVFLTIARMYVHDKQYNSALTYYNKIEEKNPSYIEALYEKTFIALKLKKTEFAIQCLDEFQKKFPSRQEAVTLNNLSAYMHLQTGNLKSTEEKIREIDKRYDALSQWIRTNFAYLDSVPQIAVDRLLEKTAGIVDTTSSVKIANELYQKISRNERDIFEARNDLRRLIFVLGRSNLDTLRPHWSQKTKELKNLSIELLGAAHRLVASELNFLKPLMDEHDYKRIENNMAKRMNMFSEKSMNRFRKGQWVRWYNFEKAVDSLNERINALMYAKAKLSANSLLIKDKKDLAFLKTVNSQLSSRLIELEAYALRGRELARKSQIGVKLDLAELPAFKKFFIGYANSIFDEEKTMEKYRDADTRFAQNELKNKFSTAWSEWEYVAQFMFKEIVKFEDQAKRDLVEQTKGLDSLLMRYESQMGKLARVRGGVEQLLAKNIKTIVRQYELDISERRSKVKKWAGDLKWLSFDNAKTGQEELQKKYLLEKELLNESL